MATIDNKKSSEMDTSDENATGPALILAGHDSTIGIKDKLYKKLGYKKGNGMPPNMTQPFAEFESLKKKRDAARLKKEST